MFKKLIAAILIVSTVLFPTTVFAQATSVANGVCGGANLSATAQQCPSNGNTDNTINSIIKTIIDLFSVLVGFLSVVFITFGAYYAVLAAGGQDTGKKARSAILYAILGLVIVLVSQVIVRVVIAKSTTTIA